jgi:hypothetical protein
MNSKLKPSIENDRSSCYVPLFNKGEGLMAEDAVLQILMTIQASIAALDNKVAALDSKVDRHFAVVTQDIRLIRGGIHDMVKTRVTTGEVDALHEDVNRVQQRIDALGMRVEILEIRETQKD